MLPSSNTVQVQITALPPYCMPESSASFNRWKQPGLLPLLIPGDQLSVLSPPAASASGRHSPGLQQLHLWGLLGNYLSASQNTLQSALWPPRVVGICIRLLHIKIFYFLLNVCVRYVINRPSSNTVQVQITALPPYCMPESSASFNTAYFSRGIGKQGAQIPIFCSLKPSIFEIRPKPPKLNFLFARRSPSIHIYFVSVTHRICTASRSV